ncbi:MAG: VacJ family lipoprotein [Alphaproteobacteria bacterium]|nr:VacJ family lipoprotein [Alphaproteobacteria bacterium]
MKKIRLLLIGLVLLTGCATAPTDPIALKEYQEVNDPMEPFNRSMQAFNDVFEKIIWRPLDTGYRFIVPEFLRNMIASALSNLSEPLTVVNDVLQGNFSDAGHNLARFGINTTAGIVGLFDVADGWGYEYKGNSFGTTLGVWGVGEGPYLVLPIVGSADIRGVAGLAVDFVADPVYYVPPLSKTNLWEQLGIAGVEMLAEYDVEGREYIDDNRAGSVDYYSNQRHAYRQAQRKAIAEAKGKSTSEVLKPYRFDVKE